MAQKKRTKEETEISYNEAIGEIETIIAELSRGSVDIDTLPSQVKRGTELIAKCRGKLRETEEAVNKVFKEE